MSENRSIIDSIKTQIKSGGSAFKDFFSIRQPGEQVRVRFLDNLDEAIEIVMHNKWKEVDHPCLSYYGKDCPNCNNPDVKDAKYYAMNLYNYETKRVEIFFFKATKATPLEQLCMIYENHEPTPSITYCDMIIKREGVKFDTRYPVMQGRIGAFPKKDEVTKYTKQEIFDKVLAAHNQLGTDIDDYVNMDELEAEFDDYEAEEAKPVRKATRKPKPVVEPEPEVEEYDEYEDDGEPWDDEEGEEEEEGEEIEEYEPPKKRTPARKAPVKRKAPARRK